jgi:hypothetical protein
MRTYLDKSETLSLLEKKDFQGGPGKRSHIYNGPYITSLHTTHSIQGW